MNTLSLNQFLSMNQDTIIDDVIQSLSGPGLTLPISLRQKSGEIKHYQMNCEIKYESFYVDRLKREETFTKLKSNPSERFRGELVNGFQKKDLTRRLLSNSAHSRQIALGRKHEIPGEYAQILCYLRDDVEMYKTIVEEKCLAKSSLFQDAFIRRVFHKMRTPLHVICNSLGISEVTLEELSEVRYHAGASSEHKKNILSPKRVTIFLCLSVLCTSVI